MNLKSEFVFSRHGLGAREAFLQRLFEIFPGAASWAILIGVVCLSFARPILAALLIIAFDFYWLLRIFHGVFFLLLSYLRMSVEKHTNWAARIRAIDELEEDVSEISTSIRREDIKDWVSLWIHKRDLSRLKERGDLPPHSEDIYHLVIFPVSKEKPEIVEPGIKSLTASGISSKRILVVIALEERAPNDVKAGVSRLEDVYGKEFLDFLVVVHPDGIPGEARVKGANVTYAAKAAAEYFENAEIPFENIVASCFDADTVVSPDYFPCLTYAFMVTPERNRASFQPIPVYHNNIWEVPGFAKVMEMGASLFIMTELTHTEKLVTFSSHSMSFKALVEAGYWPVDMISDDSSIFWKAYLHFDGDYRVVPVYATLSMDVVDAGTWWKTAQNVYKQKRRWAWGVEGFPIVMRGFLHKSAIPLTHRLKQAFRFLEGHVSWATWSFLLTILGWLPGLLAGREFSETVVYYNTGRISSVIFNLSWCALIILLLVSLTLLPRKRVKFSLLKSAGFALEWFLLPAMYVFFSALPALDAQTRLMFGRYMEFWVSDKRRDLSEKSHEVQPLARISHRI